MQLYDNRNGPSSVLNAFSIYTSKPKYLFFASPYFTNGQIVKDALDNDSQVKLIVGLNQITSPTELRALLSYPNIQIRYFTTSKFHSKLYIFGNEYAVCGSANLTGSGLSSNHEICIGVEQDEEDLFAQLVGLFQFYWDAAEPMDADDVKTFENLREGSGAVQKEDFEKKIIQIFGSIEADGTQVGKKKKSAEALYLHEYRKTYQEFLNAFETVKSAYIKDGRRKVSESELPLRIEIDQFFNYMRVEHAKGDSYNAQPLLIGKDLEETTLKYIEQWHGANWEFLTTNTLPGYRKICTALDSAEKINSSDSDQIFEAMLSCYSFHDRLRFYNDGTEGQRRDFKAKNDLTSLRKTISHLLFGKGPAVERMADCIYNPDYKLAGIANNVVQELLGWVNKENIPIYNRRTGMVLRYLGFDIKVSG